MPLYEFECPGCQHSVELLVRSPEEPAVCPDCGNDQLTRLMSAPSAPSMKGGSSSLPVAARGESCGAPRCCGGGTCG
ncbi:zinc ribbon domain-containing protein [Stieleria sp. TO1_6]|uniref:FmdB family zinc ribbon protein n=1 Tax=Stieleria tagensis TaxID=2956795 RepID=UPI00209B1D17|nr:zinc ribbon domain-containing protein [Stieleria tagensis]MCO8123629.1 zinc ribbon domain-containing protein [Stieleria tagensis]